MSSPLSQAQLALLRGALEGDTLTNHQGDPRDIAVLVRAGLLRESGVGTYVATEAGRRYGASVFDKPSTD